jgi:competence protein ComEC
VARSPAALYCFEVGQGSCAALLDPVPGRKRGQFQAAVIDVGVAGTRLVRCLQGLGVQRLSAICLTHNDADHVRGLTALVGAYRKRIGTVWLLVDRPLVPGSVWLPVQQWVEDGWVAAVERLEAPAECPPGIGRLLIGPPDVGYRLYCIYPTLFTSEAVAHGATKVVDPLGRGPNAASAVLRLTPRDAALPTHVLFGGDLDYRGWHHLVEAGRDLRAAVLVVPHHGGPALADPTFGPVELAQAVRPAFALVSVGSSNDYGHPHPVLVQALRRSGARILCTQLTLQCAAPLGAVAGGAVLPRLRELPMLSSSGVGCAGTVAVMMSDGAAPTVLRLGEHQTAVDGLMAGHHPLCRP